MFTLFNQLPPSRGTVSVASFNLLKTGLLEELERVRVFYRSNPKAVESNHLLVRLLQSVNIPINLDLAYYKDRVTDISSNLSMSLRLTSSTYSGKVWDGIFFGPGVTEALLSIDEDFSIVNFSETWRDLQPLKVMSSPKSDLNLDLLNGKPCSGEYGTAVLTINIPMLACMYREFQLTQINAGIVDMLSVMQFVHMFVLPNALASQLDCAVLNRYANCIFDLPNGVSPRKHSFWLTDYSDKFTSVTELLVAGLLRKPHKFYNMLETLPLITLDSGMEFAVLPKTIQTRQISWAFLIARINILSMLLSLDDKSNGSMNKAEKNDILRELQRMRNDKVLQSVLPVVMFNDIVERVNDDIVPYL